MQLRSNSNVRDAHAQLVLQLCEALSTFVAATAFENDAQPKFDSSANDNVASARTFVQYDDVISLRGILAEFGLKQSQVAKLRKSCGFPAPVGRARPMMFRRSEVEQWARAQPNRTNLAFVLRTRKHLSYLRDNLTG